MLQLYKKIKYTVIMLFTSLFGLNAQKVQLNPPTPAKSIYDIEVKDISGNILNMSTLKGKKILIVNVASQCGYTPQYAELEKLNKTYPTKIAVIGVPSNEFGGQEPGTNDDIQKFCSNNYGITFIMLEKSKVKGNGQHPLYQWLTNPKLNGWNSDTPSWNFCKYLIDNDGKLLAFFTSSINPMGDEIVKYLK
ncbi:MAG: glutathione peroxidase [Cytophagales bacterium]|nr:glutathione peroxidase [Cytophagales bacterium]